MAEMITPKQFHEAGGVEDWRVLADGATAFYRIPSLASVATFVQAISSLAAIEEHRPDIDIRNDGVTVRLITAEDGQYGMSRRDVEVAIQVSEIARAQGLAAVPAMVQCLTVIPGAADTAEVMPFWQAVLGYVRRPDSPDEDLIDPRDRGPGFWFERMDELRSDGAGTIHLVVWVAREHVKERLAAAIKAGGRIVHDEAAPAWWTVADPAGNEIDVAATGTV